MKHPMDLDPRLPAPDPARVSLLLALDWGPSMHGGPGAFLANATINGRPVTDEERTLLGAAMRNDFAAMDQLMHEQLRFYQEKSDLADRAVAILGRYGFDDGDETIGEVRKRMSPADGAEFDRLADILWPDGYLHLRGEDNL